MFESIGKAKQLDLEEVFIKQINVALDFVQGRSIDRSTVYLCIKSLNPF